MYVDKGKWCVCFLHMFPAERFVSPLPFGHAQWGSGCPSRRLCPQSLGKPPPRLTPSRTLACPQAFPKSPRQRLDQNPFPRAAPLPSGHSAAIVIAVCLGHLLLDVSEMGFPRAAGAAPSQYCSPKRPLRPLRLSPALVTSGFSWTHKASSALSSPPQPVC